MVSASLDFDRPGKQQGFLQVPYSHNLGGWANVCVPATILSRGRGPTVLALGGNHGDEYQGQIALMKLARDLPLSLVKGRLILIPSLNFPAARAATRLSPIDGMNMNRAFPGHAEGSVTSQIAHYLATTLFPLSDVVIDIHSGGRSMEFVPSSTMHLVADRDQRARMFAAMLAWNADFSFLYADIAGTGLLPVEAENQGKLVVTTEMGGGECVPAAVHRVTQEGLRNVLIHVGVLKGQEQTRKSLGKPPAILTQALDREDYLLAPESGVLEVCVDLGARVKRGQTLGFIHHLERPDRAPERLTARSSGYLVTMRAPCLAQQGDCVAVVAQRVTPRQVLNA
ncbi:MAG: succinylglutamate desuccinylase/aspartoacylase family protein [Verrucomicrobia bacterium]|nr:succinylglutamate desuccinylase/aspartoacylase family protein [Verrucomicrobiota bacterium]MBI3870221.1 succinylglutamate desuccinylase/aspartoacylase family protein [Verrucomicrobiota bacterium]